MTNLPTWMSTNEKDYDATGHHHCCIGDVCFCNPFGSTRREEDFAGRGEHIDAACAVGAAYAIGGRQLAE